MHTARKHCRNAGDDLYVYRQAVKILGFWRCCGARFGLPECGVSSERNSVAQAVSSILNVEAAQAACMVNCES
jgi:hypothetical protein